MFPRKKIDTKFDVLEYLLKSCMQRTAGECRTEKFGVNFCRGYGEGKGEIASEIIQLGEAVLSEEEFKKLLKIASETK